MFEKIVEIYRDITGDYTTQITPQTKVGSELQLSSLGVAQLVCEIEDIFDIEFTGKDIRSFKTVQDLTECIEKKLDEKK